MKVERIELPKELTEKTACEFIGRLASVCTGKEPENDAEAERIGRMNLTEHLGRPTRCWEFLPLYSESDYSNFRGAINNDKEYYTLKRMCKDYNTQYWMKDNYHLFKISVPKYVRDHVKTHTKLSSISSSARIGIDKEKMYEFPEIENDFNLENYDLGDSFFWYTINDVEIEYNFENYRSVLMNNNGKIFVKNFPSEVFSDLLNYFYTRKEITKRSLSDFEVVDMVIGGYFNEGWDNFIKVRTASCDGTFTCPNPECEKPCIQKETRELALIIKGLIEEEK